MDMEGKREGVSNAIIKGRGGRGRPQRKWKEERDGQRQIAVPAGARCSQGYSRFGEEGKEGRHSTRLQLTEDEDEERRTGGICLLGCLGKALSPPSLARRLLPGVQI